MISAQKCGLAETLCYVVMPDHIHWLAQLRTGSLAALMQGFKSQSAIAVNRAAVRTGTVWQPGYHDRAVRSDEDLRQLARYVVANPLRKGLTDSLSNYPLWDAIWLDQNLREHVRSHSVLDV